MTSGNFKIISQENKKSKRGVSKKLIILIAVAILLAGAIVAILIAKATGYLYFGVKQPSETVAVRTVNICDDLIDRYNNVPEVSDEGFTNYLTSLNSDIDSRSGNEKDPTCVYMKASLYKYNLDSKSNQDLINSLVDMAKNGDWPSLKIKDNTSLEGIYRIDSRSNSIIGAGGAL